MESKTAYATKLSIDDEFCSLIPPLTPEEYAGLERSIRAEGCRDALVLWGDILVDGHNRYAICKKHGIEYRTVQMAFSNRADAMGWIIRNQFARRNLTPYQRAELALRLEDVYRVKAHENESAGGGSGPSGRQKSDNPVDTKRELAAIAGVSHDTIAKAKKIHMQAPEDVKQKVRSGELSINQAYQDIRREEKQAERKERLQLAVLPEGQYQVIYADPPWAYRNSGFEMSAAEHYETLPPERIAEYRDDAGRPIQDMAADQAVLFLWTTNPLLPDALRVVKAWGFEYKTCLVWIKERHTAGFYVFGQHELLLLAVRGSGMLPTGEKPRSVIGGTNDVHSRKPEAVYGLIERMYPGLRYVEIFARANREGWASVGNEIGNNQSKAV